MRNISRAAVTANTDAATYCPELFPHIRTAVLAAGAIHGDDITANALPLAAAMLPREFRAPRWIRTAEQRAASLALIDEAATHLERVRKVAAYQETQTRTLAERSTIALALAEAEQRHALALEDEETASAMDQAAEDTQRRLETEPRRIAAGAAKRAVSRALADRAEDRRRSTSLDALAEADPGAVEVLAEVAERIGAKPATGEAVNPADAYGPTNADRIRAAILAATPNADPALRALLEDSTAAYLEAASAERDSKAGRLPTLPGALSNARGLKHDSAEAKRQRAQIRAALESLEPYRAAVLAEPNERTTPERRTLPTARRTEARTAPLAAPSREAAAPVLKRSSTPTATTTADYQGPRHQAPAPVPTAHVPAAIGTGRLLARPASPGTVTSAHGTQTGADLRKAAQERLEARQSHGAAWTQHRAEVATWSPEVTVTADAASGRALRPLDLSKPGRAAARARAKTRPAATPTHQASAVVCQVPARTIPEGWDYPAEVAHTYDLPAYSTLPRVRVLNSAREVLADRLAVDWTPDHTRRILAEVDQGKAAALALPARLEPTTGTAERPEQPETGSTAPQQGSPTTGQVASQKAPAPRKAARSGATGPTVPVTLRKPVEVATGPAPTPVGPCPACHLEHAGPCQ